MPKFIKHPKWYMLAIFLFYFGCSNNHFIVYSMNGQTLNDVSRNREYSSSRFNLYFSRDEIKREFDEIYIICTDNFYYGQFFFDEIFMDILRQKSRDLDIDALIYEKERDDYPFYNESFLYFTAIRFKEVPGGFKLLDEKN